MPHFIAIFLSDDFAARRLATSMGVVVSGTLGVLRGLVEGGSLTFAEADDLPIEHGYRSPEPHHVSNHAG